MPVDFAEMEPDFDPVPYPPDLSDDVNEFGPFHVINNHHAIINNRDISDDIDMEDEGDSLPPVSYP